MDVDRSPLRIFFVRQSRHTADVRTKSLIDPFSPPNEENQ